MNWRKNKLYFQDKNGSFSGECELIWKPKDFNTLISQNCFVKIIKIYEDRSIRHQNGKDWSDWFEDRVDKISGLNPDSEYTYVTYDDLYTDKEFTKRYFK